MNVQEQLRAFQAKRNEAAERQLALMERSGAETRTLDEEEAAEYESLETEIKHIDAHLARLKNHTEPKTTTEVKSSKGPTILVRTLDKDDDFKGQSFVRRVMAEAQAHIESYRRSPGQIAKHRWGKSNPTLCRVIESGVTKADVQGGGTDSGEWGAELVQADTRYTGDFIEVLRDKTVFDQLPLREVPAHVVIKGEDGISTAYWVGQSNAIPVTKPDYSTVSLTPLKVGAIAVVSNELLKHSSPSAEMLVRDSLVKASAERVDTTFLSTALPVAGVSPAGILVGLAALGSNGYTADAIREDINELYAPFLAARHATGLCFIMTPGRAKATGLLSNALGTREFGSLGAGGGTLEGDRVYTGDNIASGMVILLDPSEIWKIGDTGVEVSVSREASIEQADNPAGSSQPPTAATGKVTHMFQQESTAIKIVRPINYQKRRTTAVSFMEDAYWGTPGFATT